MNSLTRGFWLPLDWLFWVPYEFVITTLEKKVCESCFSCENIWSLPRLCSRQQKWVEAPRMCWDPSFHHTLWREEENYLRDWFHPFYIFLSLRNTLMSTEKSWAQSSNRTCLFQDTVIKNLYKGIHFDLFHMHFRDCVSSDEQWC